MGKHSVPDESIIDEKNQGQIAKSVRHIVCWNIQLFVERVQFSFSFSFF